MNIASNNMRQIEHLGMDIIIEDLLAFFLDEDSVYFVDDPKYPKVDIILILHRNCNDENIKEKLNESLKKILEDSDLHRFKFDVLDSTISILSELNLEMDSRNLLKIFYNVSNYIFSEELLFELKSKLIAILPSNNIGDSELRKIIENNVYTPQLMPTCLVAATYLENPIESFLHFLFKLQLVYEEDAESMELESVFRLFLEKIGEQQWRENAERILFFDRTKIDFMFDLMFRAELEPTINELEDEHNVFELTIRWPFSPEHRIPTYIKNLAPNYYFVFFLVIRKFRKSNENMSSSFLYQTPMASHLEELFIPQKSVHSQSQLEFREKSNLNFRIEETNIPEQNLNPLTRLDLKEPHHDIRNNIEFAHGSGLYSGQNFDF